MSDCFISFIIQSSYCSITRSGWHLPSPGLPWLHRSFFSTTLNKRVLFYSVDDNIIIYCNRQGVFFATISLCMVYRQDTLLQSSALPFALHPASSSNHHLYSDNRTSSRASQLLLTHVPDSLPFEEIVYP